MNGKNMANRETSACVPCVFWRPVGPNPRPRKNRALKGCGVASGGEIEDHRKTADLRCFEFDSFRLSQNDYIAAPHWIIDFGHRNVKIPSQKLSGKSFWGAVIPTGDLNVTSVP